MNNNYSKEITNEDGNKETVVLTSNDNYNVKIDKNYTISNRKTKKTNKLTERFKSSFLGSDIGIKSSGFSSIAGLALFVALTAIGLLFLLWRY